MVAPTVLVVEDNAATRRLVRLVLENEGYAVIEAGDGRSAERLVSERRPELILQDLILPDIDGVDLVHRLRAAPGGAEARILAFSGFVSQLDDVRVAGAGFDDIITKPIEPSRLLHVVSSHVPVRPPVSDRFGAGKRLLLVDDEPALLAQTRAHLERFGLGVEVARGGASALSRVRANAPDLVVADVMMPDLDGYGLVMALRQDPALAATPVVLVSTSFVDPTDRELARRAGAADLVVRTPDLRELVAAVRATLSARPMAAPEPLAAAQLERDQVGRIVRQLESNVLVNARMVQRCSALAAELRVLAGISDAVLRQRDVDATVDEVLDACLDAGGVSLGALYRLDEAGGLRVRALGAAGGRATELASFFGHEDLLRELMAGGRTTALPSPEVPEPVSREVLDRCGAGSGLVVPLIHGGRAVGALFMASSGRDLDDDDWKAFAQGVASQIALALALAGAFADVEASRAEWRALVEHAPDFVLQVDRGGIVRFINRTTPPNARETALGLRWTLYAAPEYHEAMERALAEVLTAGTAQNLEVVDLTGRWFSITIGPVRRGAAIDGAIAVARDITQRKQTEAQLIVSDRMASVGTLAAGVAHEINNPLAAVLANLELAQGAIEELATRTPVGDLGELIREARDASERVRQIVRDLRLFSRAEEEQHGPIDVRTVLDSSVRLAWNEIRHRARLVRDFREIPAVLGNESRLGQVFLNILVNAAQAIPEGQAERNEIAVRTRVDGDRIAIEITDSGCGMTPEVQRRLFTPFFTTKPVGVGTGLGLSICQRIVSAIGGEIRVESALGRGSTFTVHLPSAPAAAAVVADRRRATAGARRRGRVLVIDDEPMIATAVRRMLSIDHDVTTVGRAEDALTRLRAGDEYDVILCDLMMPQITGMDLHAEVKRALPHLLERMIFMTGGAFTVRARQFLDEVPNRWLEKPFDAQQLRYLVDRMVREIP